MVDVESEVVVVLMVVVGVIVATLVAATTSVLIILTVCGTRAVVSMTVEVPIKPPVVLV